MIRFRDATEADVPAVVALLADDFLGAGRELAPLDSYLAAFRAIAAEPNNCLVVGERNDLVVATYQITFISGLSLAATRRAQVESVRIASADRGHGLGMLLMADAEARARGAGCTLIQLTSNRAREASHRFYERLGYQPSHIGFKRRL
jgi:GNAT superfamily N-acetyltransferase